MTVTIRSRDLAVHAQFDIRPGTDDGAVIEEVWWENVYRMTSDLLRGAVVVDVGANVGAFTALAVAAGAALVVAIEPDPDNFEALRRNTAGESVVLVNAAVGDEPRVGRLEGVGAGVTVVADHMGTIPVHRLDDLLDHYAPAVDRIDVLKIDTEGAEPDIIFGCSDRLLGSVRRLVVEFHDADLGDVRREMHPEWPGMVARIAEHFNTRIVGRPSTGGMIYGDGYQ